MAYRGDPRHKPEHVSDTSEMLALAHTCVENSGGNGLWQQQEG